MGHTIASLRRAVIAKAFLILSSPRLEASCIGEAGINLLGGKEEEKRGRRGKEGIQGSNHQCNVQVCLDLGRAEEKKHFLEPQSLAPWLLGLAPSAPSVDSSSLLPMTMYSKYNTAMSWTARAPLSSSSDALLQAYLQLPPDR